MFISKAPKIAILLPTLAPPIYIFFFFCLIIGRIGHEPSHDGFVFQHFDLLMKIHMFFMILSLALLLFYIVYLFRTERVEQQKKALWGVALFLGGPLANPIFWYYYIWKPARATSAEPAEPANHLPQDHEKI